MLQFIRVAKNQTRLSIELEQTEEQLGHFLRMERVILPNSKAYYNENCL